MDQLQRLQTFLVRDLAGPHHRRGMLLTGGAAAAVVLGYGVAWCVRDYQDYMALGPGGTPHNVFGWAAVNIFIRPFALSRQGALSTSDYPAEGSHADVQALPDRKGEDGEQRPALRFVVPHRQISQLAPESMREFIQNLFTNAVTRNPDLLETKRSLYEVHHDGLFVSPTLLATATAAPGEHDATASSSSKLPEAAIRSKGEIGHVHEELSVHLYVSAADARQLIEKGWAERHRMSLPRRSWISSLSPITDTYLMLYGPRDEGELEVLKVILLNSIRFMTGKEEIADIGWRTKA